MIRSQITNEAALFPAYSCPQRDTLAPPARSLHFTFHVAVEVIPPAGNTVDALALEGLLSSLGLQVPFALEIAADKNGSHFIARARRAVLAHLCSQLENVYGQVEFHPLTEEKDPARQLRVVALIEQFEPDGGRKVAMGPVAPAAVRGTAAAHLPGRRLPRGQPHPGRPGRLWARGRGSLPRGCRRSRPYHRECHREYSWRGSTARVLSWQAWR